MKRLMEKLGGAERRRLEKSRTGDALNKDVQQWRSAEKARRAQKAEDEARSATRSENALLKQREAVVLRQSEASNYLYGASDRMRRLRELFKGSEEALDHVRRNPPDGYLVESTKSQLRMVASRSTDDIRKSLNLAEKHLKEAYAMDAEAGSSQVGVLDFTKRNIARGRAVLAEVEAEMERLRRAVAELK
ncbi:hypothetical protein AB0M44_39130 [Streptosporangium subroseum]|uniref:hypothetical protein n=1 Tax=Streptosporangium subroseum TaxID=106412 RepID=UPI003426F4AF